MRFLIILTVILITHYANFAQGCSDAGMCSVSALGSGFEDENNKNVDVKIASVFGLGEQNVFHVSTELTTTFNTFKNQSIQIKVPYLATFGNLGNISGLGDIFLSVDQSIFRGKQYSASIVAGIKIPSNDANKTLNGYSLPMAYQTSLGTYDLILGFSIIHKSWHFGFGYQHTFSHNLNEFEHRLDNPTYFNNYNESYHLKRADDIMARLEYRFKLKKSKLLVGALPIYHLGEDAIKGGQKVAKSSGLTFNLVARLQKQINNSWHVEFVLAAPIIDKEVRPDGLTRSFVAMVSFQKTITK